MVSSPIMLVLKTQMCSNAIGKLENYQKTVRAENCIQLNQAESTKHSHRQTHASNTYWLLQITKFY